MQPHTASWTCSAPSRDATALPNPVQTSTAASSFQLQPIAPGGLDTSQFCSFWRNNLNLPPLPTFFTAQDPNPPLQPFPSAMTSSHQQQRQYQQQSWCPSPSPFLDVDVASAQSRMPSTVYNFRQSSTEIPTTGETQLTLSKEIPVGRAAKGAGGAGVSVKRKLQSV
eukprot:455-Rhodomonas_salina.3